MNDRWEPATWQERVQIWVAERAAPPLIRLVGRSIRWTWKVHPETADRLARGRPVIYAFWHGRMLPLVYSHRGLEIQVLVSLNRDGELITRVIERMGFGTARGSTSRGGLAALRQIVRRARGGRCCAFTPDGPRGPRERVQEGVVVAAALSGIPVVPTGSSAWPAGHLASWDRFLVPWPFGRGAVVHAAPISVPPAAARQPAEWGRRVEIEIARATEEADRMTRGNVTASA
jgi:lysophospholipid acyltransferase (LPLAT)-like uncharacterized protein